MSLTSLLTSAETEIEKLNPLSIAQAAEADVNAIKADLLEVKTILASFAPAIQSLITFVTPLLPGGVTIPVQVTELLSALNRATSSSSVSSTPSILTTESAP